MGNVSVIKENGREFSHTDSDLYLATISDKKWQNMHSSKAMIQLLVGVSNSHCNTVLVSHLLQRHGIL